MMTAKKKKKILQEEEEERRGGSTSAAAAAAAAGPAPDRISELPVEILHRILGFLEMDESLIQTSLVSTKWSNLWKSVSNLNFPRCVDRGSSSRRSSDHGGGIRSNVEKYENFVDHVLRLRDSQASKIEIFRYYCDDYISTGRRGFDYLERILSLIVSANEIEIVIMGGLSGNNMITHFNPYIFNSRELRKFQFTIFNRQYLIQFPPSMCWASQLTELRLEGIRFPVGDVSNAQLHLVYPVLETFTMVSCVTEPDCMSHLFVNVCNCTFLVMYPIVRTML